jgi:DUF1016 N-terminal domain
MKRMKREPMAAYDVLLVEVADVVEAARYAAARSVNAVMTATYWFVGRRLVEHEQQGAARAAYGERLLKRLARDLSERFGRGFSERNLEQMRAFYLGWPISQIASAKLPSSSSRRAKRISQTVSAKFIEISADAIHSRFPLPWSHYARLLAVRSVDARAFYESEALRGGWTIRQLDRQIQSQFYERTALSRDKAAVLRGGARRVSGAPMLSMTLLLVGMSLLRAPASESSCGISRSDSFSTGWVGLHRSWRWRLPIIGSTTYIRSWTATGASAGS